MDLSMEENRINTTPETEEEGLDIMALLRQLWDGRLRIIIWTLVFILLGLFAALTMKRTYTVKTVMVPQMNSKSNNPLSSLASLAGFDLSTTTSGTELSPLVYPQIVNSVPFRKELMYTPLHYAKLDTAVSLYAYVMDYSQPTLGDKVKKYTIGLPFVILKSIMGEKKPEEIVLPVDSTSMDAPQPVVITKDEEKVLEMVGRCVSLDVDKKEGYVTLNVTGSEPIQTAELAMKAQQLLQDEVTRFRLEKSQSELEYIQARYNEIKRETEATQSQLAKIQDRSQNLGSMQDRVEHDRVQAKYNVANSVYIEMAKQLEQAKMQVKKDTPLFTVIQPVTVPTKPSNSRAKTLVIWTFLGFVLGCGMVLLRGYMPKLKASFKASGNEQEASKAKETHQATVAPETGQPQEA